MNKEHFWRISRFFAAVALGYTPDMWRTGLCGNVSYILAERSEATDETLEELLNYFEENSLHKGYPVEGGAEDYYKYHNKYGNHDYGLARRRLAKALSIHFWNKWREANETTIQQAV